MVDNMSLGRLLLSFAGVALIPGAAFAQDAAAVLRQASAAMGGDGLNSIRYAGDGTGYTFGQACLPGTAWPRITVHCQVRSINYDTGSMREEITLSRAEPKGGGGYPLAGQQKNDRFVSGTYAWNQAGAAPAPGPRFWRIARISYGSRRTA
ncbi:MAG: hypothetical protein JWQ23_3835 [Herminiimonas sp.]|nr:hypothetical protein [Herminiimonas sp.]